MSIQEKITILDSSDEDENIRTTAYLPKSQNISKSDLHSILEALDLEQLKSNYEFGYKAVTIGVSSNKRLKNNVHTMAVHNEERCIEEQPLEKKFKFSNYCHSISVPVHSIIAQQYTIIPSSSLEIEETSLIIAYANSLLKLEWNMIKCLELSSNLNEPCLFIVVFKNHWKTIVANLELVSKTKTIDDSPNSSDDKKYIIFYIQKVWFDENHEKLRNRLKSQSIVEKRASIYKEISEIEANTRQIMIAEATVFGSVKIDQNSQVFQPQSIKTFSAKRPILNVSNSNNLNATIAVYPPPPSSGGIVITKKDYRCLEEGQFLNDVIIDFYLRYLMNEVLSDEDSQRSHVFSSFFYSRLSQNLESKCSTTKNNTFLSAAEQRYQRVRNWSKKVDIFSKNYLFIPINNAAHWYLAVIYFPDKTIDAGTANPSDSCILIFNSIQGGENNDEAAYLRGYLNEEWKNRKSTTCGKRWFDDIRCFYPRVPQQNNNYDCGVFLLHYVEKIFQNPNKDFTSFIKWFSSSEIPLKRSKIKKTIDCLRSQQASSSLF